MSALLPTKTVHRGGRGVTKKRRTGTTNYDLLCQETSAFAEAVQALVDSNDGTRISRRVNQNHKMKEEPKTETTITSTEKTPRQIIADMAEADPQIAYLLFLINWKY